MTALKKLLECYRRAAADNQREKGTYFEDLVVCYLKNEPKYKDLYAELMPYAAWADRENLTKRDTGIDLVAITRGTNETHAIQCKFYSGKIYKEDIDSFFTASGKKPFSQRIIVLTGELGTNAKDALEGQQIPVVTLDLNDLETAQIDWSQWQPNQPQVAYKPKKTPHPYQDQAIRDVMTGLALNDRGKLLMACGTGKTFTSLKIAETLAGAGKRVLFLVPSLSLLSQTLTEWTQDSGVPLHSFAVCSDSDVGKKRANKSNDEAPDLYQHELRYPATTNARSLAHAVALRHDPQHMTVVFSTYHSIEVIGTAQTDHGLADFDLIICDEAHRTTGVNFGDDDESAFIQVHSNDNIRAAKRLYMTATPRIYGEVAKAKAKDSSVVLCSMDDESLYGPVLHVLNFSTAVSKGLLVDYKVLVLAVDEAHISSRLQKLLSAGDNSIKVEDASKIVGCWKALSKQGIQEDIPDDANAMQRAVAFCQVIEAQTGQKKHKISSKKIASMFAAVVDEYKRTNPDEVCASLTCEAEHVDGSMNATEKADKLAWLKADIAPETCRILSNVRCLSEGVDVPALDAVLFLTPRNSEVDVVQSVGRVMRKAPGKKRGYIILPIVIPAGIEPDKALDDNEAYGVVWKVLQALRAHDDRFEAMINKIDFDGADPSRIEVVPVTDAIPNRQAAQAYRVAKDKGYGSYALGDNWTERGEESPQASFTFNFGEIERAIYAKVVKKCGNRLYWEDWARDVAKIAQTHITRIRTILNAPDNHTERAAFDDFLAELRDDLNNSIAEDEVIEMLAQHLITRPVFDALFSGYEFTRHNPISQAMQKVLDTLDQHHLEKEVDSLILFYDSVRNRASGINTAVGRQKIVVELYDKFFRTAFPRMTERLGIVYTPVEVVDFILNSVNHVLQHQFQQTLGSDGVHILDPFTGTGTFITRLIQSGLITPDQLPDKYHRQIHANEIVLLAYYIAAINIESAYHEVMGGDYQPFEGICLTDTFQMYEKDDLVSILMPDNSDRRKRQKALDIRVIIGNPPYSAGQKSENDNNQNVEYPSLDQKIRDTYAAKSKAILSKNLYDSYIRAIRWASDRIGNQGVIGFVTGSGFLEKGAMDGLRHCLAEEFSTLYLFNLRGDVRKNMLSQGRAKEGQNIFGNKNMTGVAVSILVKNPASATKGQIFYHDIGDDLSETEKLTILADFQSIATVPWQRITPNAHHDWLNQRGGAWAAYPSLGNKKNKGEQVLFENFSLGVATNRDVWCYNASQAVVNANMRRMIGFYNQQVADYAALPTPKPAIDDFIDTDNRKISWSSTLLSKFERGKRFAFMPQSLTKSLYRPFTKSWLYYNRNFNDRVGQMPQIFPDAAADNRVICVTGIGGRSGFSVLMSDHLPCLDLIEKGQCFPRYLYDSDKKGGNDLFSPSQGHHRDGLTDAGLTLFQQAYADATITKDDVFYYIYGLLHSPDYRQRFANDLLRELPRIPPVATRADFNAFATAGRALAELHVHYDAVEPYAGVTISGENNNVSYRVEKMRYGRCGKDKDKTTIHYNHAITVSNIPARAYDYIVNGKAALDWVVDRQGVRTDKDSGIVNDANLWATASEAAEIKTETMKNPRYPLDLLLRVITVSLKTMDIVDSLPALHLPDAE